MAGYEIKSNKSMMDSPVLILSHGKSLDECFFSFNNKEIKANNNGNMEVIINTNKD